jgi:hypothetical protein
LAYVLAIEVKAILPKTYLQVTKLIILQKKKILSEGRGR